MNETLTKFRNAVADSTDLQEKAKAGADLVALGSDVGGESAQAAVRPPCLHLRPEYDQQAGYFEPLWK